MNKFCSQNNLQGYMLINEWYIKDMMMQKCPARSALPFPSHANTFFRFQTERNENTSATGQSKEDELDGNM